MYYPWFLVLNGTQSFPYLHSILNYYNYLLKNPVDFVSFELPSLKVLL